MRSPRRNALLGGLVAALLTPPATLEQVQAPANSDAEVSELEYTVFSAYITEAFTGAKGENRTGSRVSSIVIVNKTRSDMDYSHIEDERDKPLSWKKAAKYLRKEVPTLRQEAIERLREVGTQWAPFRASFQLPIPYQLVDAKEIDKIFKNEGWWTDYYKKYPGTQGILVLSRIGFSTDAKQALFYAVNSCGGKCGTETYVVMQRSDSGWKLQKEILIGVS
jgi:hypothetical protein